ncbi:MAG: helix-turn-helix transcriptional regulator [Geminicoccaceae bacterium]
MTTREDILSQLRRGNLTTAELADRLGLSRNAVVLPLGHLMSEGLVRRAAPRRSGQAGKPAHEFEIVPGHEDSISTAYRPFTDFMLTVLPRHQTAAEIENLMLDLGREMANHMPSTDQMAFADRLVAARAVVDGLGAATELIVKGDSMVVQSRSCPLAAAVRKEPCVCKAVAAFFEAATGHKATERCIRGEKLTCRFEIEASAQEYSKQSRISAPDPGEVG